MEILSNVTTTGTGLFAAQTFQAEFLRSSRAYNPDIDPRMPVHDALAGNLTIWPNATVIVSNIDLYPTPNVAASSYGAIRVKGEVILYGNLFTGNSTLANLTRNVASTINSTISGNLTSGNIVTILGLRTVTTQGLDHAK